MKKLILLLLACSLKLLATGQTSDSNNALAISYIGYFHQAYKISLTNKQSCEAEVRVSWSGGDTAVEMAPQEEKQLFLPATFRGTEQIRTKTNHTCVATSSGWLTIMPVATTLALQDNRIKPPAKETPVSLVDIAIYDLNGYTVAITKAVGAGSLIKQLKPGAYFIREGRQSRAILIR